MKRALDRLPGVIERLRAEGLIPPVKAVEMAAGGIIRVTVIGVAGPDLRTRLTAAMDTARWKLVEASDDKDAGVDFRPRGLG